jgi:hypothetical protein
MANGKWQIVNSEWLIVIAGGIQPPEMMSGMNSPTWGGTIQFCRDRNEVSPDSDGVRTRSASVLTEPRTDSVGRPFMGLRGSGGGQAPSLRIPLSISEAHVRYPTAPQPHRFTIQDNPSLRQAGLRFLEATWATTISITISTVSRCLCPVAGLLFPVPYLLYMLFPISLTRPGYFPGLRSPVPGFLARGAVHYGLSFAGLRWR